MSNRRRQSVCGSTKKDLIGRIKRFEEAIAKSNEYLASGEHADWAGFRPFFMPKVRGGRELPPHRDWVKNVYLPRMEKALNRAERILEKFLERQEGNTP